jgi:hypothetical protein
LFDFIKTEIDCISSHYNATPLYTEILLILFVCLMVLDATFNNISVISWWSVLLVEETGGPAENH